MITQSIDIKTQDGICDAFVAYPSEAGTFPGVLFYVDAFGLRPYLNSMVEKLASHGFYVLAPNILYRAKRSPILDVTYPLKAEDMPKIREKIIPLARGLQPEQAMSDASFYLDYLASQPQVTGKFGTTGYCMGGSLSLRTASRFPERIAAAACFHAGHLATDAADSPHRWLQQAKAELYIANADNDASMPPEQIERLRAELNRLGLKYEMETYPGAAHGFTMADLPMYNAEALEKHWLKLFELFDRTLSALK